MGTGGAQQLASVSSFAGSEPLKLPFDLQRSALFLVVIALGCMALVAAALALDPKFGVAMVLVLAAGFAVALNQTLGLGLLVALVPITSGLARGLPAPGLRISEILVGGIGVMLLLTARRTARWTALDWLAVVYATATLALGSWNLLQRGEPFTQDFMGQMLGPFQFLLLYRAVAVTATGPETRRMVVRLLLLASIPVALLAVGQQFGLPGFREMVVTLTGSDIYSSDGTRTLRATGPFPHWHNLGGYLLILLLLNTALIVRGVQGVLPRWGLLAIAALDAVALLCTVSIAPIACAVAGALILGVWLGNLERMVLGLAVGALLAAVLFAPTFEARYNEQFQRAPGEERSAFVPQTVQYRYELWTNQLLPELDGRWITGYGPDLPPALQRFPHTESLYLALLFRGGILLFLAWAALVSAMVWAGLKAGRDEDPLQQALGPAIVTGLVVVTFIHFFQSYFFDSGMPHVLWPLLGLLAFRDRENRWTPVRKRSGELTAMRQAAASRRVLAALGTLDPGSRALLELSYSHHVGDDRVVTFVGVDMRTMRTWRATALERLATMTRLPERQIKQILAGDSQAGRYSNIR